MGELLPDPARIPKKDTGNKFEKELPEGLNFRRAYAARAISKNPEIVEKVKKQAREIKFVAARRIGELVPPEPKGGESRTGEAKSVMRTLKFPSSASPSSAS